MNPSMREPQLAGTAHSLHLAMKFDIAHRPRSAPLKSVHGGRRHRRQRAEKRDLISPGATST